MITGGDASLAMYLRKELTEAIENKTQALISAPTEGLAGEIRGLQDALRLMGTAYDKLTQRRPEPKP